MAGYPKRLARAVARRGRRLLARARYQAMVRLRPRDARAWFRLGRAKERTGDVPGAAKAYRVALGHRPEDASSHAALGRIASAERRWEDAARHYEEALRLRPEVVKWTRGLAQSLLKRGDPAGALAVIDKAVANGAAQERFLKVLGPAAEEAGQWDRASAALRKLVESKPGSHSLRARLARCLEKQYLVPFTFGSDGVPVPATASEDVFAEAVEHLTYLVEHAPDRVHSAFRLGYLHERHGDSSAAARAYRTGTDRLERTDTSRVHRSLHYWNFRHDYVTDDQPGDDERLGRSSKPAAGRADAGEAGGFFQTVIADHGLRIDGFLRPLGGDSVDIHLDGKLLKTVIADTKPYLPAFSYVVLHDALARFPEHSELSFSSGGHRLLTVGGATASTISVPGGTGEINKLLADGKEFTKKGEWPLTEAEKSERQRAWLDVYERTKDLLEEHFGKQLFLLYGTLLGSHRDGGFIPGDDDFDVAYLADATNPEDLKRELQETALALLGHGLDIGCAINGRMFKTGIGGVWIDITPVWFFQNRAWSFNGHDLDREDFAPAVPVTFHGEPAYTPHDTEAFLAENYGPDWRTPNSGFRYYRPAADGKILERTWLTPSDVKDFTRRAEEISAANPSAGSFAGLEIPGLKLFS